VQPIQAFAASLRRSAAEIITYAKHHITNGKMEDSTIWSHDSSTAPMASDQSPTSSGEPGRRLSHRTVKLSADLHEISILFNSA
jgi:hypothetical protein